MKIPFYVLGALVCGLGLARGEAQTSDTDPSTVTPSTPNSVPNPVLTHDEFLARYKALQEKGDWAALHALGRDQEMAHPEDSDALYAQGLASYMLGDLDATTTEMEKFLATNPADAKNARFWIGNAGIIKRNFPDFQLKPLQFVTGDADAETQKWIRQGAALLAAKKYDEIEKVAAQLQKSNAANVQGAPHLASFFAGLTQSAGGLPVTQKRIAAWRVARPKSNLARLAAVAMWTSAGYDARGSGVASTITDAMSARIDAALQKGAATLKTLPASAFDSPLAFDVVLGWGLLASAPREYFDHYFETGIKKFPNYLPLYTQRAHDLLPRWFGEPGEWEAMAKKRADQIGGEEGDVFYAHIVWSLNQTVSDLPADPNDLSYKRARRGLENLQEFHPESVSVASALLQLALHAGDNTTIKQLLAAPQGYILDDSWREWSTPRQQAVFSEIRMGILGSIINQ